MGSADADPYCAPMEPAAGAAPVRILLMGLTESVVRSLARCIAGDARYTLAGAVPSIGIAEMLLPVVRPHFALVDWTALRGSPTEAISRLRSARPVLHIACMAGEEAPYREASLRAGADFFLLSERLGEELPLMLEGVAQQSRGVP